MQTKLLAAVGLAWSVVGCGGPAANTGLSTTPVEGEEQAGSTAEASSRPSPVEANPEAATSSSSARGIGAPAGERDAEDATAEPQEQCDIRRVWRLALETVQDDCPEKEDSILARPTLTGIVFRLEGNPQKGYLVTQGGAGKNIADVEFDPNRPCQVTVVWTDDPGMNEAGFERYRFDVKWYDDVINGTGELTVLDRRAFDQGKVKPTCSQRFRVTAGRQPRELYMKLD